MAGIPIGEEQCRQFATYCGLLETHGRRLNLTAVTARDRVRDELFLRSLGIAAALDEGERRRHLGEGRRALDVGSGAGIPGIPLAIAFPGVHVTLLEPTRKKTEFLEIAIATIGLGRVDVLHGRAEDAARMEAHREAYDLVVSRAVAALPELAELTIPFCAIGGMAAALKGADVEPEAERARWAAAELGASVAELRPVTPGRRALPDTAVIWRKVSPTPSRYPRRSGIPHKRPLAAPAGSFDEGRDA